MGSVSCNKNNMCRLHFVWFVLCLFLIVVGRSDGMAWQENVRPKMSVQLGKSLGVNS